MADETDDASFEAVLRRPVDAGDGDWAFVVLPKSASATLPRRGRTTVDGTLAGVPFRATLEPDGQRSHWLKVDPTLRKAAGVDAGDTVAITLRPVDEEPDPPVPDDFAKALKSNADARATWATATTIARIDWIHWIESAKQAKTRTKRIADAIDMLAGGKRAVCCFDPSGFYSKAFAAPKASG
jgi:hypothetical protein